VKTDSVKKKVLFVCTHNAVRSQMAEAFLNKICGDRYTAVSAGSDPAQIDPLVVSVMNEIGIDLSYAYSKGLDMFKDDNFDYVVTVCDQARESCPYFPGGKFNIHKGFSDPSTFQGSPDEKIQEYKKTRDEIKTWIEKEFQNEGKS
jgi:arsenate reductase